MHKCYTALCLQITETPQPQSMVHPWFYGCLNQQYIEKSCAAQAQSICIHLLWPYIPSAQSLQHSRQVVVFWMVAHVHTRVFGGDTRSFAPSAVPNVIAPLLHPSDTGTIKRDVMGVSYRNDFCFAISPTSSACRWIPCATRCSPRWLWMVRSWALGMRGRMERVWSQDKKAEWCELHKSTYYTFFNIPVRVP